MIRFLIVKHYSLRGSKVVACDADTMQGEHLGIGEATAEPETPCHSKCFSSPSSFALRSLRTELASALGDNLTLGVHPRIDLESFCVRDYGTCWWQSTDF